jgi:hypothetical protein
VSPLRAARASAFAADDATAAAPPHAAAPTGSKWARAAPLVAPCHVTPPEEAAAPLFATMLPRHNGAPLRGWTQPASVLYSQPVAAHAAGGAPAKPRVFGVVDDDDDDDAFRDDRHDDWAGGAASDDDGEFQAQQHEKSPHSPPRAGAGAAGGRFARKRAADDAHAESPAAAESSPEATSPWPRAAAAAAPLQLEQATNAARAIGVYKRLRQGFTPRPPAAVPPAEPPGAAGAAAGGAAAAPRRGVQKPPATYQRSLAAFLTRR